MMNKPKICVAALFFLLCGGTSLKAQGQGGKWAVGGQLGGNIGGGKQEYMDGIQKNSSLNFNTVLNCGKFIGNNTLALLIAGISYSRNETKREFSSGKQDNYKTLSYEPLVGVGIRKYFPLGKKNIAGFFVEGQVTAGKNINRRLDNYSIVNPTTLEVTRMNVNEKSTYKTAGLKVFPAVYLNLNSKWQINMQVGNLNYNYRWDPVGPFSGGVGTGSSFGLSLNTSTIRIGVMRTLG